MNRIAGRLLVASPYLTEESFFRTVLYMVRHDAEGAFGLILNRRTEHTLEEIFADRLGHVPKRTDKIHFGGPVEGPLMALHTLPGLGEPCGPEVLQLSPETISDEVAGSSPVWITADDDHLTMLVNRVDLEVRFLSRYSGWGPSQLDRELNQGGWLVGPPDWRTIFADADGMWENVIKRLGRDILGGIISTPLTDDPQWN